MCTRAGARSVAAMTARLILLAAATALAASAPPARAAGAVYGGSTSGREPIAVTANKAMTKLTSTVVGWSADCDDGSSFFSSRELTPAVAEPGFRPGPDELLMSRNAKGRFKGTRLGVSDNGSTSAAIIFEIAGKLSPHRASGTLSATVKMVDKATGNAVASCQTGTMRWAATRAPGKVFAGKTSQDEPVVVRVDPKRRKVSDLMLTWESQSCMPATLIRVPDDLGNFPMSRAGAFGDSFPESYAMDGGGKRTFAYNVAGHVTRTTARGSYHVTMNEADAAGTQTRGCDTGSITWKARTG
jgi:hypothetical protein